MDREYFYDNGSVAYTVDDGNISSANILGGYQNVIGSYRGSEYYVYNKDVQGSTSSITDSSLGAANVYEYSDFGEVTESEADIYNEICYTGAIYDATTGIHYMNARYYDPSNGRFISQDSYRGSVNDPGQWHLYAYCANNPINYTDPSGHWVISYGWKIELAATIGVYGLLSVNHDKTHISVTLSAGLKLATNILTGAAFLATFYNCSDVSKLVGKSAFVGASWSFFSVGKSLSISSDGTVEGTVSGSFGFNAAGWLPWWLPYVEAEFGNTWQEKKWKRTAVSTKTKTSTVAGIKIERKRYNTFTRIRIPAFKRQIKIYEKKSRISTY